MKITIDTKEDSSEDIRKVIALLSKMIEDSPTSSSNIFEDSGSEDSGSESAGANAFANMFGNDNKGGIDGTPVLGVDSGKESEEKEEEETPSVIEY